MKSKLDDVDGETELITGPKVAADKCGNSSVRRVCAMMAGDS